MILGEMQHLIFPSEVIDDKNNINLEEANGVGISGLNSYYSINKIAEFPYARVAEVSNFESE